MVTKTELLIQEKAKELIFEELLTEKTKLLENTIRDILHEKNYKGVTNLNIIMRDYISSIITCEVTKIIDTKREEINQKVNCILNNQQLDKLIESIKMTLWNNVEFSVNIKTKY